MFTQKSHNEIIYMSSDKLKTPHAFTTRFGGVSRGIFESLNFASNLGDDRNAVRENYRRLCELFGVGIDDCAVTRQVHKAEVRIVTKADRHVCLSETPYEADGIVTAERGLPIICFTADCVPVLLWDGVHGVIGAVHCGWKSSAADILSNALDAMRSLGAENADIHAALGPAIGKCCFETDDDVPQAIEKYLSGDTEGLFVRRPDGKTMVDLRLANARRLIQLGVKSGNIDISDECTYCNHDKYWSHRYTKGQRGSQASVIMLE